MRAIERVSGRRAQRGITFLGWLVLLVPLAIVVYAGIRVTPIYLNYMRVAHSLESLPAQEQSGNVNADSLRQALAKSFNIETIERPTYQDIDIHRVGDHWAAVADYEDAAPLFGDISILIQFHKEVDLP